MKLTSPSFKQGSWIPTKHTGRGADISPQLSIDELPKGTISIAITLDDDSHPLFPKFNHWLIWNIPPITTIHENIEHGETVASLGSARQGFAYGKYRYRGPKPPFKWLHDYTFTLYALDCFLDLPTAAKKLDLTYAMKGHILAHAALTGKYQTGHKD